MRPAARRPAASRRGKSLIEMMVIIVWTSTLVGIAGQMLFRLARVERSGRDEAVIGRSEFRLARDLRADAHQATAMTLLRDGAGDPIGVRLATPSGPVEYAAADEGVRRTAGENRYEGYRLGPTAVTFAVEDDRFVTVSIRPRRDAGRFAAGPLRVVAALRGAVASANLQASKPGRPPVEAPRPTSTPANTEAAP